MSTTPLTLEAARRKIGEIFVYHMPFNRELGLELRRFDDDYVELSFTNQRKLVGNAAQEILHGGVIAAVLDVVMKDLHGSTQVSKRIQGAGGLRLAEPLSARIARQAR